jgi:VCBS repeat-containing protein
MSDVVTHIGTVIGVNGQAWAESADGTRPLEQDGVVYEGEKIHTGPDSSVEIRFLDDTLLSQGEDSSLSLDDYVYDAHDEDASNLDFGLLKGAFRHVSGKIAESSPENVRLESPLAVIGIRGTVTVHDIGDGQEGEVHGVESISPGHRVIIQDNFGEIRIITQPMVKIEVSPDAPMEFVEPLTPQDLDFFHSFAPGALEISGTGEGAEEIESVLAGDGVEASSDDADQGRESGQGDEDGTGGKPGVAGESQAAPDTSSSESTGDDEPIAGEDNPEGPDAVETAFAVIPYEDPAEDQAESGVEISGEDGMFEAQALTPTSGSTLLLAPASLDYSGESDTVSGEFSYFGQENDTLLAPETTQDAPTISLQSPGYWEHMSSGGYPDHSWLPSGYQAVDGSEGDDVIQANVSPGGSGPFALFGYGGNDWLEAAADHIFYGGAGNDTVVAGAGNNTIYGGSGNDEIRSNGPGYAADDSIDGGDGTDTLVLQAGDVVQNAFASNARLTGVEIVHIEGTATGADLSGQSENFLVDGSSQALSQHLIGGSGNDTLIGSSSAGSTIEGGSGSDSLVGGAGNDFFLAGGGDTVVGGAGGDVLRASSASLDLLSSTSVSGVERVDLAGVGSTLTVRGDAILANAAADPLGDATFALAVSGDTGDLIRFGGDSWQWSLQGEGVSIGDGRLYDVYESTKDGEAATLRLYVQQGLGTDSDLNDAPVVSSPVALGAMNEDGTFTLTEAALLTNATDVDGDALSVSGLVLASGSGGLADNGDGTWTFTPTADWSGSVSFAYTVTDGLGGEAQTTANLTVNAVNDAPAVSGVVNLGAMNEDAGLVVSEAQLLSLAADVEGDTLSVADLIIASGSGGLADNGDGTWTFTPTADWNGAVTFGYTVTDGRGGETAATASLTVTAVGDAPVAVNDVNEIFEGTASAAGNVLSNDTDADGDDLDVAGFATGDADDGDLETPDTDGSIVGVYGTLVWTAETGEYTYSLDNANATVQALGTGETLTETFTYEVGDGTGSIDTATLTITINGANDGPVASADTNWAREDTADASGNVLQALVHAGAPSGAYADAADTDVDAESLTVTGHSGGDVYGTLTLNANGSYDYVLDNGNAAVQALDDGETLTETYTYTVSDGTATDTATLTITIHGANDAPSIVTNTTLSVSGAAETTITSAGLLAGDPDNTAAELAYTVTQAPSLGKLLLDGVEITDFSSPVFTQADIDAGRVSYRFDSAAPGESVRVLEDDSFQFTVSDGTATTAAAVFNIHDADGTVQVLGTNLDDDLTAATDFSRAGTVFHVYGYDGDDALRGGSGNDTLQGGLGADSFRYSSPTELSGDSIDGTLEQGTWDLIQIDASAAGQTYDFASASIQNVDGIQVMSDVAGLSLVLGSQIAGTADFEMDGTLGDFFVYFDDGSATSADMANGISIDGSALTSSQHLYFEGEGGWYDGHYYGQFEGGDTILGGQGSDELWSGLGNDSMSAGAGNDTLRGGEGADTLTGGSDQDFFEYTDATQSNTLDGVDTIADFTSGEDVLWFEGVSEKTEFFYRGADAFTVGDFAQARFDSVTNMLQVDSDGDGAEDMRIHLSSAPVLDQGDFVWFSSFTGPSPDSNPENWELRSQYPDEVDTNWWFDWFVNDGAGFVVSTGDAGDDIVLNSTNYPGQYDQNQMTAVFSFGGNDTVDASNSLAATYLYGGAGDDTVFGGAGDDTIYGGTGNDALEGLSGNDSIEGGAGDDFLAGYAGSDTLTGGLGADIFNYLYPEAITGDVIDGTLEQSTRDFIRINPQLEGQTFDFTTAASIQNIDGIHVMADVAGTSLGLGSQIAGTADFFLDGAPGEIIVLYDDLTPGSPAMVNGIHVDGSGLTSSQSLIFDGYPYKSGDSYYEGYPFETGNASYGGFAGDDTVIGGQGTDYLSGGAGSDSIAGGLGDDYFYVVSPGDLVGDAFDGGIEQNTLDRIRIQEQSTGQTFDFRDMASVLYIDRIEIADDVAGTGLVIGAEIAATADDNRDGVFGDIRVDFRSDGAAMTHGVYVDASEMLSTQRLYFEGEGYEDGGVFYAGFDGNDTVLGGAGSDQLFGGLGADSLVGGLGGDRFWSYSPESLTGDSIEGTQEQGTWDRIVVAAQSAGQTFDFGVATSIQHIDVIDIDSDIAGTTLVLGSQIAATGDYNKDNILGDIRVAYRGGSNPPDAMVNDIVVDGSALGASQSLYFEGEGYQEGGVYYAGFAGNDTVLGGQGNDLLMGGDGNDEITGGQGSDTLHGGSGADSLEGGEGNDLFTGGLGADSLYSGVGEDKFVYYNHHEVTDDVLVAGDGAGEQDKIIIEPNGENQVYDFTTASISGIEKVSIEVDRVGTRIYLGGNLGSVVDYNGDGVSDVKVLYNDTGATISSKVEGVFVDASGFDATQGLIFNGDGGFDSDAGSVFGQFWGSDTVYGGAGNDEIYVNDGDNLVYGGAGNDTIDGTDGNHRFYGEDGNDSIDAYDGTDVLDGGNGNDTLSGGDGADTMTGGLGADSLVGGLGGDRFWVYAPLELTNDSIEGTEEQGTWDRLVIAAQSTGQTFDLGVATSIQHVDLIDIDSDVAGTTLVLGSQIAATGDHNQDGVLGDIRVAYRGGSNPPDAMVNDIVVDGSALGAGQSLYFEGEGYFDGVEYRAGFAGNDSIVGGSGDDYLEGGAGNDYVNAGPGNDSVDGGPGNDRLVGHAGSDTLTGGLGGDYFLYDYSEALPGDVIDGTSEQATRDFIRIDAQLDNQTFDFTTAASIQNIDGIHVMSDVVGLNLVLGSQIASTADFGMDGTPGDFIVLFDNNSVPNIPMVNGISVDGSALTASQSLIFDGNPFESGGLYYGGFGGNDTVTGGQGTDYLTGGAGSDSLVGGLGGDRFYVSAPGDLVGDSFDGVVEQDTWDRIRIKGQSEGQSFDFREMASVQYIDRIDIVDDVAGTRLVLGSVIAATADNSKDGVFGDLVVDFRDESGPNSADMTNGVYVDGSEMLASQRLYFEGEGYLSEGQYYGVFAGSDTVLGGAGDDRLAGGLGADSLAGGQGSDRFIVYTPEALNGDTVVGGSLPGDVDRLVIWPSADNLHFDLSTASLTDIDRIDVYSDRVGTRIDVSQSLASTSDYNGDGTLGDVRVAFRDAYDAAVAKVNGLYVDASGLDVTQSLYFNGAGYEQDGSIYSECRGDDTVIGGSGDDILEGGAGSDLLLGGAGNDYLLGNTGNDILDGADGEDTLEGAQGTQTLIGGSGNDVFVFWTVQSSNTVDGVDTITDFVSGQDTVEFQLLSTKATFIYRDTLAFASGDFAQARFDTATNMLLVDADGDATEDMRIHFQNAPDLVQGDFQWTVVLSPDNSPDNWEYRSDYPADVDTNWWFDWFWDAGVSFVVSTSDAGDNVVLNGENYPGDYDPNQMTAVFTLGGDDVIDASTSLAATYLYGGAGDDSIIGGAGNDTICGGTGADTMTGGSGSDTFVISSPSELVNDVIDGTLEQGTFDFLRIAAVDAAQTFDLSTASIQNIDAIEIGADVAGTRIVLGSQIVATADLEQDGSSAPGEGEITFYFYDGNLNTTHMTNGIHIDGSDLTADQSLFFEGPGISAGSDYYAGFDGDDTIVGGLGADDLGGGFGNDSIDAGGGNDELTGGADADILTGGDGADIFYYSEVSDSNSVDGVDLITDFASGLDDIHFWGGLLTGTFTYRGEDAFQADGNAQARLDVFDTYSMLHVDVNGDATADMDIQLDSVNSLSVDDFAVV